MQKHILEYLNTQRIGVLAVEMPDGSPHAATVHFAHADEPLVFYFETDPQYRKTESLTGRDKSRASFVVGVDGNDLKTFQLDGYVQLLTPTEQEEFERVYLRKFPEKKDKYKGQILFTFTPTWWRFTDWTTPQGKQIWTNEEEKTA